MTSSNISWTREKSEIISYSLIFRISLETMTRANLSLEPLVDKLCSLRLHLRLLGSENWNTHNLVMVKAMRIFTKTPTRM